MTLASRPRRAVHDNIRRLRVERDLTKKQLADRVGVDKSLILQWEIGECAPAWWRMPTVAAELGVSVDELTDGPSGKPRRAAPAPKRLARGAKARKAS